MEAIRCPLCGVDQPQEFLLAEDLKEFSPGQFRYVQCGACRLVYLSPRPSAADMGRYYPSQYWAAPPAEGEEPFLDRGTRRILAILARDHPGGRVLDVGCGVGVLPALMRERGLDAIGLEPYDEVCRIARERYVGLEVICGTLTDADLPQASFDAVTFVDVIEHLPDPLADLRQALRLLRPGGVLFIKTPNLNSLQARLLGRWWYALDTPRHLTLFAPGTLRRMLHAAGFADAVCRPIRDPVGAMWFEASVLFRLRGLLLERRGVQVQPTEGQTVGEALEGQVYATVPSAGKRVFRWLVRNVLYAPLALENVVGRSVELLAVAKRPARTQGDGHGG